MGNTPSLSKENEELRQRVDTLNEQYSALLFDYSKLQAERDEALGYGQSDIMPPTGPSYPWKELAKELGDKHHEPGTAHGTFADTAVRVIREYKAQVASFSPILDIYHSNADYLKKLWEGMSDFISKEGELTTEKALRIIKDQEKKIKRQGTLISELGELVHQKVDEISELKDKATDLKEDKNSSKNRT
jgi:polyhydroxyalkanoate synthesis regulator phasin